MILFGPWFGDSFDMRDMDCDSESVRVSHGCKSLFELVVPHSKS